MGASGVPCAQGMGAPCTKPTGRRYSLLVLLGVWSKVQPSSATMPSVPNNPSSEEGGLGWAEVVPAAHAHLRALTSNSPRELSLWGSTDTSPPWTCSRGLSVRRDKCLPVPCGLHWPATPPPPADAIQHPTYGAKGLLIPPSRAREVESPHSKGA